ncbi:MAG: potassium-transporting ATPase subunit KdpA [Victivallaceae bacterium]|jgi:K+-transporting ATPase ATPase A chain
MSMLFTILFLTAAVAVSWPLGYFMFRVMEPGPKLSPLHGGLEKFITRIGGKFITQGSDWKEYCIAMLIFNTLMFAAVFLVLLGQSVLPLNPDGKGPLELSLLFHTVASFITNTNQQHYSGEVSLSYFSQFALMWLQFLTPAVGLAALAALSRAMAGSTDVGNFYRDTLRATLFIMLPIAIVVGLILVFSGVPMTLGGTIKAITLEGPEQLISRGPVAAFVAIKQLGTNGGGFFGPNSAHPFENPGYFTNAVECLCIIIIPMACVWMFGRITGRMKHAMLIFVVMGSLMGVSIGLAEYFENAPSGALTGLAVARSGGNLEGKELRIGTEASALWSVVATSTSNGSGNCMYDSLNPLTLLLPLFGMWSNVAFGGIGVGFINMFLYIIIGVFICGMMVGRSPEYLARKVETGEMKLALLALLVHPLLILGCTAWFAMTPLGAGTIGNPGSHGFTEILYEFTSAAANNGSGMGGLKNSTVPWNAAAGIVMLLARFIPIILPLAIAGMLAAKKPVPETSGTLHTDRTLFGFVLLGSVIFIGALLFLPVAVLGPIAEHLSSLTR